MYFKRVSLLIAILPLVFFSFSCSDSPVASESDFNIEARVGSAQIAIGIIYMSSQVFHYDHGYYPASPYVLLDYGYIILDEETLDIWSFNVVYSDTLERIEAVSTENNPAGEDKTLYYNLEIGNFTGYGCLLKD